MLMSPAPLRACPGREHRSSVRAQPCYALSTACVPEAVRRACAVAAKGRCPSAPARRPIGVLGRNRRGLPQRVTRPALPTAREPPAARTGRVGWVVLRWRPQPSHRSRPVVASKGLGVAVLRRPPRARTVVVAAGCVLLVWLLFSLAGLYTDLLWFREVGKTRVFWGVLGARGLLAVGAGVGTGAFLVANLRVAARRARRRDAAVDSEAVAPDRWQALLAPRLRELEAVLVAVLVLGVALHAGGKWQTLLLWRNRVPFGDTDAQFHRDIGYYTFTLPMQRLVFGWLLFTLLATLLAAGAAWYLRGGIRPQLAGRRVSAAAHAHLSLLLGLALLLKAWGYRLDQFSLVFSPRGVVTGASYTDVHAQLPALRLMVLLAPLCAVLVFATSRSRGFVLPVSGLVLFWLSSILVGGVFPTVVQRFQVAPQELQQPRIRPLSVLGRIGDDRLGLAEATARAFGGPAHVQFDEPIPRLSGCTRCFAFTGLPVAQPNDRGD